jgi:hypothetical protein
MRSVVCARRLGTTVVALMAVMLVAAAVSSEATDEFDVTSADVMYGVAADTGMTPDAVFVDEYVRTGNAYMACNRAGILDTRYPLEVTARKTLERPEIQAAIEVARSLYKANEKRVPGLYSREMLLDELQRVHEQSLHDRSYAASISAVKTQAQMLGYLETTININHGVSARELSLSDLRRMVSERAGSGEMIDVTPVVVPEVKGIGNESGV